MVNATVESRPLAYRPDIDGIRALAVILVIVYHAFPSRLPGGFIGVDVFFVISGFLITHIILDEANAGRFTFTDFYVRRCRRILPALAVVLIGTWLIGCATLIGIEFKSLGRHIVAGSTFSSNVLLWSETGYFDGPAAFKPLLHLWSLGVEEQYYLIWPLLLLLLLKRARLAPIVIGATLILSFALCVATSGVHPSAAFYLLPARFWELLAGAGLAFADAAKPSLPRFAGAWSAAGLAAIVGAAVLIDPTQPYPGWTTLAPVLGAALLVFAGPKNPINRLFALRPAVTVGLISYPLYLWHWPLLSIFSVVKTQIHPSPSAEKLVKLALVAASFVLAFLTYRFVERPVQARVRRYSVDMKTKRRAIAAMVGGLAAVGLLGGATVAFDGFVFRHRVLDPLRYEQHNQDVSLEFFDDDLARFPRCQGAYTQLPRSSWCYQATADAPDIALIGDSHARALFPGFAESVEQQHIGHVLLAARCAPLLNVNVSDERECLETNRTMMRLLANDPSIHTVVLSSRGPLYITGTGYGPAEVGIGKVLEDPPGAASHHPTMASRFEAGYADTIRALSAAGKRVVFVVDVPELGFMPGECLYSRPYQGRNARLRIPCAVSAADVRVRQSAYRDVVRDLAAAQSDLRVFDTASLLCDGARCYAESDGRFLYTDANHLGVEGSRLVGGALAGFVARATTWPAVVGN